MKDFDTIHVKCRPGKAVFELLTFFIVSFILHYIIAGWFGKYTDLLVWQNSLFKARMIYCVLFSLIIILVVIKKKSNKYFLKCYDKIIIKNSKKMQYTIVAYEQSMLQKCFGVITVKFYNLDSTEKLILKDVSKSILYYL